MHKSDVLSNGLIVQTWDRCKRLYTSLPHVCKAIRISESRKFLLVESRILGFGIQSCRNPESKFHWQRKYLESEIQGMESRTQTCPGGKHQFPTGEWKSSNNAGILMPALIPEVCTGKIKIFPVHTSRDMSDRRIMKVYSPGTPHGMVMKAFFRRTRPSIYLSKERFRNVLPTIRLSD